MLTSLVLILTTDTPLTFPPHLGRASHAAFLRLISQVDPDLAEQLHAPNQRRPFTCSNLWGVHRQGRSLTLAPGASAFRNGVFWCKRVLVCYSPWEFIVA